MKHNSTIYRLLNEPEGLRYQGGAVAYAVLAYAAGLAGLFHGNPPRKGDYRWEQEHTFSNPHTLNYPFINWLTLNFGFHNAHHARMTLPWYRLPETHRELFGNDPSAVIPLRARLRIFHKQRVHRIVGNHGENMPTGRYLAAAQRADVFGGNAASFLTSF